MRVFDSSIDPTLLARNELWWQKHGKSGKNDVVSDLMTSVPIKTALPKPDWNSIPSKDAAMSEEEFEEAIKALALKTAEKGSNAAEEMELLTKYISVASPDRKAAYERYNGSDRIIYGELNQELLVFGNNGKWGTGMLTKDELSRYSKFYEIYQNTIKEYEAEHGQIADAEKSKYTNPYALLAEYNRSYSFFNQLA